MGGNRHPESTLIQYVNCAINRNRHPELTSQLIWWHAALVYLICRFDFPHLLVPAMGVSG